MDADVDEFGQTIEPDEYSGSEISEGEKDWIEDEKVEEEESNDNVPLQYFSYDSQSLSEPLVQPPKNHEDCLIATDTQDFHLGIMNDAPSLVRNVAIVGGLKHGKTSLTRWILEKALGSPKACLDRNNQIELQRNLSLFPTFASVPITTSWAKTIVLNVADTQGHSDFELDVQNTTKICEGLINVVDIIEGTAETTSSKPRILIINKLDRLIFDQRLPPFDACKRIFLLASEHNAELENVVFASTKFRFVFTLASIAKLYNKFQPSETSRFRETDLTNERTFTRFVLDPLYKLFSFGLLGKESQPTLTRIGVVLDETEWNLNPNERIQLIMDRYFDSGISPLIDAIFAQLPPMNESSPTDTSVVIPYDDSYSYSIERAEDDLVDNSQKLLLPYGNKFLMASRLSKGCWYMKRVEVKENETDHTKLELSGSVLSIEIEPVKSTNADFIKLGEALDHLCEYFRALHYTVGDRGNYFVRGTGELYLDTALGYLRSQGHAFQIGIPSCVFHETIAAESPLSFPTKIPGDPTQSVTITASPRASATYEESLVWCESEMNCILLGPGLKSDYSDLIVDRIIEGFLWFTKRGPLLDGLVHDVVINLSEMDVKEGKFTLSTTVQRACSAATLLASPVLMEPVQKVTVIGGLDAGKACYSEVAKRGGNVVSDDPIVGTSLFVTRALVPAIDSFGLATDIKCQLQSDNQSKVSISWHGWQVCSGNPQDPAAQTHRLEAAPDEFRANDFMVKTRLSKGLTAEPQLDHYIDERVRRLIT